MRGRRAGFEALAARIAHRTRLLAGGAELVSKLWQLASPIEPGS